MHRWQPAPKRLVRGLSAPRARRRCHAASPANNPTRRRRRGDTTKRAGVAVDDRGHGLADERGLRTARRGGHILQRSLQVLRDIASTQQQRSVRCRSRLNCGRRRARRRGPCVLLPSVAETTGQRVGRSPDAEFPCKHGTSSPSRIANRCEHWDLGCRRVQHPSHVGVLHSGGAGAHVAGCRLSTLCTSVGMNECKFLLHLLTTVHALCVHSALR
jgi:hypothetical protein